MPAPTLLSSLDVVDVATPCPADWEQMDGDDRVRRCSLCNLNVYNLSALPEAEALQLVREQEGRLCVRFFRRADGKLITRDCPVGLRAVRRKAAALWAKATALCGAMFFGGVLGRGEAGEAADKPAEARPVVAVKGKLCINPSLLQNGWLHLKPAQLKLLLTELLKEERQSAGGMPDPARAAALSEQVRQRLEQQLADPKWTAPQPGSKQHQTLTKQMQRLAARHPAVMQRHLASLIGPQIDPPEQVLGRMIIRRPPAIEPLPPRR